MSFLASRRGCQLWQRRLQRVVLQSGASLSIWRTSSRHVSSSSHDELTKTTRNIGIIAHIDAVRVLRPFIFMILCANSNTGQDNYYRAHALLQRVYSSNWKYDSSLFHFIYLLVTRTFFDPYILFPNMPFYIKSRTGLLTSSRR